MGFPSSPVVGLAAEVARDPFNAGQLQTLFMKAGLERFQPRDWYGKSALIADTIAAAQRKAADGDEAAWDGLTEFVRLVAVRVAPGDVEDEVEPGTAFSNLREAVRSDGYDLRPEYADESGE